MYQSDVTRMRVLDRAQQFMYAAEPGIMSITQIAGRLCNDMLMCNTTVRRYLYLNILAGHLIDLHPDKSWRVMLPEAQRAGLGVIRLCVDVFAVDEKREATRLVLAPDWQHGYVRAVGPGTVSYLTTKDHASAFVQRVKAERPKRIDS